MCMFITTFSRVFLLLCAGLASCLSFAQDKDQSEWERAKGIYLERENAGRSKPTHERQAVQFFTLLPDTGARVSTEHIFYSGDRLKFQLLLKRSAFVYVFNSTIENEDPARLYETTKGITRVRENEPVRFGPPTEPPRLLIPAEAGSPLRVSASVLTDPGLFTMDSHPGLEIVWVVVSPEPIEVFHISNALAATEDTAEAAIANLQKGSLAVWRSNCDISIAPDQGYRSTTDRGITPVEKESYVVAKDTQKPFAFQVMLQHYSGSRP